MVLVDTTVWIDFFKGRETQEVKHLEALLSEDVDVVTTGIVVQEILTGIQVKRDRQRVRRQLDAFIAVQPAMDTHVRAAEIFDACRKRGYTIRSLVDCLIAALALEHDLSLLEKDRDYAFIAQVFPLKTMR